MIATFPATARVWIYQADEPFAAEDVSAIQEEIQQFAQAWISHNRQLRASGELLHERFVVLIVDESQADASGCSIDKSVGFLKALGAKYKRDLFDRMRFTYETSSGDLETVDKDTFQTRYQKGIIDDQTPVFDPLVNTVGALQSQFRKPLSDSWHRRFV